MWRADQSPGAVLGGDRVDDDRGVAERRALDQPLQPGDQRRVAAPVDSQRLTSCRTGGGLEIGVDVAATKGIDRLLGVTDQHHRGVAGERPVQHLPLHRIGVLELVDQHDPPPLPHSQPSRGPVIGQ